MIPARPRFALVLAAVLTVATALAPAAAAGEGPRNGRISFGRFDPALDDFSIWTADADGGRQQRLTREPSSFSDWSPDGRTIVHDVVEASGSVQVAVVPAAGGAGRRLTTGRGVHEAPKWSPDGRRIAYDASPRLPDDPGFRTAIWVMAADGTQQRQLTTDGFDVEPVFSPDGASIAFVRIVEQSDDSQTSAVYVVPSGGGRPRQVVPPTVGLEHPDWSPDGRLITFNIGPEYTAAPNAGSVFAVRPDGRGLRMHTPATRRFVFFKPVWSPDGRFLLTGCGAPAGGVDMLCRLDAAGNGPRVVVRGDQSVNYPAWGPRP